LVTGGGTGIGLACAQAIVAGGGKVMLAGRRSDVVQSAARSVGASAAWVQCDVTNDESVDAAVRATEAQLGPLRLAVNAAGMGSIGTVLNASTGDFVQTLDTNLVGVFRSLRAEARAMRVHGGGSIVNISSIAGTVRADSTRSPAR